MSKVLKFLLLALGGVLALLVAAVAYIAATFDPDAYKPLLIERVQKDYRRTLAIPGPLSLSFWPRLGVKLGAVSLSERESGVEFASWRSAQVSLAAWPLLRRELVVDRVEVAGLRASVTRFKDGRLSIDDLGTGRDAKPPPAAGAPAAAPLTLDIAGIAITDAALTFVDQQAPRRLQLTRAGIETGRVAIGVPVPVSLKGRLDADAPRLGADFALEGRLAIGPAPGKLALDALKATLGVTLEGQTLTATLAGALAGDTAAQRYALERLTLDATLPQPKGGTLALAARGALTAQLGEKARIDATLDGRFDASNFKLKLALPRLAPVAYAFDVEVDQLDLDRYRSAAAPAAAGSSAGAAPPLDLSALRELDATGQLRVGSLQVMNLKASQLRAGLRASGGRVALEPLAAGLYEGRLQGRASVATAATPRLGLDLQLSGIAIGPLLKDLSGRDLIDGRGQVTLDVTTAGATVGALTQALDGRATLALKDGAVRGINIAQTLRQARAKLAGSAGGTAASGESTDFSELSAGFTITRGVAHNDDLLAKTPLLRVGGSGDIDLGAGRLDYLVKATVVPTLEGQGGPELQALRGQTVPVRLSGPFTAIDWKIEFGALARDAAKQQLERKLGGPLEEKAKEKGKALEQDARQKLGDKLKDLLGR